MVWQAKLSNTTRITMKTNGSATETMKPTRIAMEMIGCRKKLLQTCNVCVTIPI